MVNFPEMCLLRRPSLSLACNEAKSVPISERSEPENVIFGGNKPDRGHSELCSLCVMLLPTGRHYGQASSSTSEISLLVSYARASYFYESRQMTVLLRWAPEDRGQMV